MHPRKLHTTGRLATRMSEADIQSLHTRLAAYTPDEAFLNHPELELELGIGNGMALYERARNNPSAHFLGAELYLNGLEVVAREMDKHPLANLRLLNKDGRDLLENLPANSLARLLVLFPDPWPKSKHHKRRVVQTELLDVAARALKPAGELWVVSDWPSYVFHSIATIYPHPAFTMAQTDRAAADCKPAARLAEGVEAPLLGPHILEQAPAWWVKTKYQKKAEVAGRAPWFLCAYRRQPV